MATAAARAHQMTGVNTTLCQNHWHNCNVEFFERVSNDEEFARQECTKIKRAKLDCKTFAIKDTPMLFSHMRTQFAAAINGVTDEDGYYSVIEVFGRRYMHQH